MPCHKVSETNPLEMLVLPIHRESIDEWSLTITYHHTLKHLPALSRMHNLQYHTEKMRKSKVSFFSNIAMRSVHAMLSSSQKIRNVPFVHTSSWKVVQLLQNLAPSP